MGHGLVHTAGVNKAILLLDGGEVTGSVEVLADRAVGDKKTPCLPWRFEPLHLTFLLSRR
jgi:hypothetical protein